MANDGTIKIGTLLDKSGLKSGLSSIGSMAEKGFSALKTSAKVAASAIAGVTAALGAGVAASIKVGASFEEEMSKVQAISGVTQDEFQQLTNKAKEMGAKTKFSATESGQAMEYMAMAGWKAADMLDGIEGIMNLAAASGEDLATTSDIVTDALTAFGLAASDSTHFADILASASSNANTNVGMMGETFKYVAPLAGALKYSAEDVAVAIGLMANSGIKASQAGTSLRSIMTRMAKPTKDSDMAMSDLGLSITDSEGNMKSFSEVMKDMRTSFADLTEDEKASYAAMLGGQEAMSGLLAIVNASDDDFEKLTKSIEECDGASEKMAATMQDNLQGQLTILQSSAEGLGLAVYESIQEPLTNLAKKGIEAVNELTKAFETGGTGGLIKAGAKILTDVLIGIAQALPTAVETAVQVIQTVIDTIGENLPQVLEAGGQILWSLATGIMQLLPSLGGLALNIIQTLAEGIVANLPTVNKKGQELFTQFCDAIRTKLPEIVVAGTEMLTNLVNGLLQEIPNVISQASGMMVDFLDAILSALPSLWQSGADMITNLLQGITESLPGVLEQGEQMLTDFLDTIVAHLPDLLDKGCDIILNIVQGIIRSAPQIISQIGTMLIKLIGKIQSYLPQILQKGVEIIGKLLAGLIKAVPDILMGIGKIVVDLGKAFLETDWGGIGLDIIKGIATGIANAVGSLIEAAVEAAKKAFNAVKDFLGIQSPSKLMRDLIGKNMIAGIEVGIESEEESLADTASGTTRKAVKSMQKASAPEAVSVLRGRAYQITAENDYPKHSMLFMPAGDDYHTEREPVESLDYDRMAEATAKAMENVSFKVGKREIGRVVREVQR